MDGVPQDINGMIEFDKAVEKIGTDVEDRHRGRRVGRDVLLGTDDQTPGAPNINLNMQDPKHWDVSGKVETKGSEKAPMI